MVIGFDGSRAFGKERTGTENYSYQLLKALAKIDRVNQYIIYTRNYKNDAIASKMKVGENFHFRQIGWLKLWTQLGLAIQTFKDPLDVLFIPAHTLPVIRKPGLKTVVTVHDLGSEYLPSMHQLKQKAYLGFMQRYQLKGAAKIIAVSKATKNDLVEKVGIEDGKVVVAYEGYDKEKFKCQMSNVKTDLLVNSLRPYYLFVGTIQPRKNLVRIMEAFSKVGKANLVIAGSKGWLSDEIYTLPKKLGIEEKIKFLGYVPDEDLPKLYCGAIALLFPSLFEGFGLPILEAQACGCPVVTSNISSMPEVANKGAIFVNPYDVDDIASGMMKIMDGRVRDQLIKAGFENIKRFSWDKCARETLKILESI